MFGRYVARRLVKAEHDLAAAQVTAANQALLAAARRVEDLEYPEQEAIADRDAADDDLDEATSLVRLRLASRGVSASKERPYIDIFPKGIEYYTAARLGEQSERYGELLERLQRLDPQDEVRTELVPRIVAALAAWKAAVSAVESARSQIGLARTARDAAADDWRVTLEKVYGLLINAVGKRRAERFFPRTTRRRAELPLEAPEANEE